MEASTHSHSRLTATAPSSWHRTAQIGRTGSYDVRRFVRARFELGREADGALNLFAFFSRSGHEIYYTLQKRPEETAVFARPADGFGEARPLSAPDGFKVAEDRTADGRHLVCLRNDLALIGRSNIYVSRNDGDDGKGKTIHFSQNTERELGIALSPNDRYLAYTSTLGGQLEVYVRPFPEGRGRWQISRNGGEAPVWSSDGKELFFKAGNALMRVNVSTTGEFSAGQPEALFEHPTLNVVSIPKARYAVSRDGQRVLDRRVRARSYGPRRSVRRELAAGIQPRRAQARKLAAREFYKAAATSSV